MLPFYIQAPSSGRVPILLSVPHCGVEFPDDITSEYKQSLIQSPDDTDWFVHQLYDFVSALGITMIHAKYSRWVIDLNRDPQSKPLYSDGRIITALCPTTTFFGESIYNDGRNVVDTNEVERRVEKYYDPYHREIQKHLDDLKNQFGKVLLWDCHSIRQSVPTIHKEKFPDLILGDADETSASLKLIETTVQGLKTGAYGFSHNYPFKGGYITRSFGKPAENQHALQLEMTKVNYMDDGEKKYDTVRANKMREVLKTTLSNLAAALLK
ncbi:MAG TPA: N-formylglutamate amidohydrolase [Cyclobacteriaceae bacterium]